MQKYANGKLRGTSLKGTYSSSERDWQYRMYYPFCEASSRLDLQHLKDLINYPLFIWAEKIWKKVVLRIPRRLAKKLLYQEEFYNK